MVIEENRPYGYIYKATNTINGKVYIGKTEKTIEKRWNGHLKEARALVRLREAFPNEKISGTHFNNALNKYGPDVFNLNQEDIADSKVELNKKEKYYIKEYDSMNPDKGYNMTEGGEGGRLRPEVIEKLRKISLELAKDPEWHEKVSKGVSAKYQNDPVYSERQTQERRERAKDPEWIEKMTKINQKRAKDPEWIEKMTKINQERAKDPEWREKMTNINQERAKDPEWREKMTKINQEKGKDPNFQEKVSKAITNKWDKDPEYRKKQEDERKERAKDPNFINKMREIGKLTRKEISDKRQFLNEIKNNMPKKDMLEKYDIGKTAFTKRIQEMFGPNGPKSYTELKDYLKDKDVNEVRNEIKEREAGEEGEKSLTESGSEESKGKTSENLNKSGIGVNYRNLIDDKREFLNDIKKGMSQLDISDEYNIDGSTLNLVISDMFGENGPRSHKSLYHYLQNTDIDDVIKDIKEREQGSEIRYDKNLPNESDFAGSEESQINAPTKDYEGINQIQTEKGADFKGIDENDDGDSAKDYNNLEETPPERGIDFDGIDKPQEKGDRDFENLDEGQPEGGVESGGGP